MSRSGISTIVGLHHVQIAAPPGCEEAARRFYGDLLGLPELAKPAELQANGGVWFELGDQQLHVGVDPDFHPARKAHPALLMVNITTLNALEARLNLDGIETRRDDNFPGFRRFYADDPFGNRLEFLCPGF